VVQKLGPVNPGTFVSTPEIEEPLFEKLKSKAGKSTKRTIEPGDRSYMTASLGRNLTKEDAEGLINHTKMLYIVGFSAWTDATGRHEEDVCNFVTSDRPMRNSTPLYTGGCQTHNGLQKVATD